MRYIKIFLLTVFLCSSLIGKSQTNIQFIPEIYGTSINGLMNATIFTVAQKNAVRLSITVSEAKAGKIVTIQTPPFNLIQGNNLIPQVAVRAAKVSIAENNIGAYLRKNQYFPEGAYEYAFTIIAASSSEEIIVDQTFIHDIVPPAPMDLIEPYNEDKICEKRPVFTWQPSIPQVLGTLYQLLLVEIKERQNAVEALNYNLPIVNQKGIFANMLMYPPIAQDLVQGKKYAWQVTAYKDQTVINRSAVWAFKVDCQDSISAVVDTDWGYRDIEDLVKGNYYVAEGTVKFALINAYQEQKLQYTVVCTSHPSTVVRNLPKVKLKRGTNKIKLDFSHNFSFKEDYSYVLKVKLPNGIQKDLRFIYKEVK